MRQLPKFTPAMAYFKSKINQPLDRVAITLILILALLTAILLLTGDRTTPKVRDFSWQGKQIGANDVAFILTFNRPMNRASVEKNLRINPPLPGKISWAGRRMAYTLTTPPPYGTAYSVQLQGATDRFSHKPEKPGAVVQPFTGFFKSRDQGFVYIGTSGDDAGRLILVNLTQKSRPLPLTPKELVVMDFKLYPTGDRILFSALDRASQGQSVLEQQLFTVTTGITPQVPNETKAAKLAPVGTIQNILDAKDYQNLKFDLSPDGNTIVVERANRKNPIDSGLWILRQNSQPYILKNEKGQPVQGGNFLIAPDSHALVLLQGEGTAIVPLQPEAQTLEFLPKFGNVFNFTRQGDGAAMVKFNPDGTQSLFLVTSQTEPREILRTRPYGKILSADFDPSQTILYCLLTQVLEGQKEYAEQPYIAAVNLNTLEWVPLVILPQQRDIKVSLSPDGLALLFDQTVTQPDKKDDSGTTQSPTRTHSGEAVATSRLWLLPLIAEATANGEEPQLKPEELPFEGFHPVWLP